MWRLFNSMRDMYSNVTLILTAIIVIVLTQVNPKAASVEVAKPPGQMMVCASWLGHSDIDLWFRPPGQEKASGYSNKNGGIADLLLDDLGTKDIPHVECQFASSLPDGLWVLNLHGYAVLEKSVSVHVVARMGTTLIIETDLDIRQAQERTVVQFRLAGGRVVAGSLNEVYVPLRSAKK
ncbi:hypothetical protein LB521_27635 [Mesorhizobium sp. BR-1-1-8]|uniref:hypothetical protein n=1 Tax=Mesorhizobium sp. BR-1-1-8 TaxID=2876659 RepID=UPI001CCC62C7|nr:hypothetical protein [Mesorhizobium sp. BR-1-1-8]MBZ9984909.1 hypothetical protein [Mesorhizobium sp. BR-1-1-8]